MKSTDFNVDVAALKKIMVDMNIDTISELAKQSGVNRNTLSDVLSEKARPSSDVMYKLVACLKIPPARAGEIFFNNSLRVA